MGRRPAADLDGRGNVGTIFDDVAIDVSGRMLDVDESVVALDEPAPALQSRQGGEHRVDIHRPANSP